MQIALMYEIMGVLANEFIFGRILDRFPRLKLVCSEFEISWIPPFMWRLDQMQEDFGYRLDLPKLDLKASDYMRRRIWHGVIDDPFAAESVKKIGTEQGDVGARTSPTYGPSDSTPRADWVRCSKSSGRTKRRRWWAGPSPTSFPSRRLEPRRSLRMSQVSEIGFLREGTRLRRVRGIREACARKELRARLVGLRRSLARPFVQWPVD